MWCAWQNAYPGQKFNKFHNAFCVTRDFVHKYEMAGIVSEEGSEAFNAALENIKNRLSGMPETTRKAELMCARTQGNTKCEVLNSKRKVIEDRTGKERGTYRVRAAVETGGKVVSSVVEEVEYRGERYFRIHDGMLVPLDWRDVYDWVVGKIAPREWREMMARSAPDSMNELGRMKERFSPWS